MWRLQQQLARFPSSAPAAGAAAAAAAAAALTATGSEAMKRCSRLQLDMLPA